MRTFCPKSIAGPIKSVQSRAFSNVQVLAQPSPSIALPSSHSSVPPSVFQRKPSPQRAAEQVRPAPSGQESFLFPSPSSQTSVPPSVFQRNPSPQDAARQLPPVPSGQESELSPSPSSQISMPFRMNPSPQRAGLQRLSGFPASPLGQASVVEVLPSSHCSVPPSVFHRCPSPQIAGSHVPFVPSGQRSVLLPSPSSHCSPCSTAALPQTGFVIPEQVVLQRFASPF